MYELITLFFVVLLFIRNFEKKINEKYSVVVPFDFNDYNDLSQYIVDSSKRLIDISLERTYTLKGKKIKLGK